MLLWSLHKKKSFHDTDDSKKDGIGLEFSKYESIQVRLFQETDLSSQKVLAQDYLLHKYSKIQFQQNILYTKSI